MLNTLEKVSRSQLVAWNSISLNKMAQDPYVPEDPKAKLLGGLDS